MSDNAAENKTLTVVVAEDRLKAWVNVLNAAAADFQPPKAEEVIAALTAAQIAITESVERCVGEMVAACVKAVAEAAEGQPPKLPDAFLVAEGVKPVEAEDGQFEYAPALYEKIRKPAEDERIDYFAQNEILTVGAGTVIGRVVPPRNGTPGVDVFGAKQPPRKAKGVPIKVGPGLKIAHDDPNTIVAEVPGRFACERDKLRMYEVLDIPGDVDFNSGSVDALVDVNVRGSIRANFKVHTTGALTVGRVVEAADVDVGKDVLVRGGVFGHEGHGRLKAGGSITANFINDTRVVADGDICFVKELLNSRVCARGRVVSERGTIIGGDVYARNGIEARVLGSDANVSTAVAVGTNVNVLRRARRTEAKVKELRRSADQIRRAIQPLMADIKRLLPSQRERVTELMCKADEVELRVADLQEQRAKMLADTEPSEKPHVLVNEVLYPGVHLIIQGREVHFQRMLHGPVKIELRKVDDVTQVVAVNQRTGSVTTIPATDVDLDAPPTDEEDDEQTDTSSNETSKSTANDRNA